MSKTRQSVLIWVCSWEPTFVKVYTYVCIHQGVKFTEICTFILNEVPVAWRKANINFRAFTPFECRAKPNALGNKGDFLSIDNQSVSLNRQHQSIHSDFRKMLQGLILSLHGSLIGIRTILRHSDSILAFVIKFLKLVMLESNVEAFICKLVLT